LKPGVRILAQSVPVRPGLVSGCENFLAIMEVIGERNEETQIAVLSSSPINGD